MAPKSAPRKDVARSTPTLDDDPFADRIGARKVPDDPFADRVGAPKARGMKLQAEKTPVPTVDMLMGTTGIWGAL